MADGGAVSAFEEGALLDAAMQNTGLSDFGDDEFREAISNVSSFPRGRMNRLITYIP